jgi:hypothetical protein
MTTSQIPFLYEIIHGDVIPPGKRAYFQERLRNRLYNLILGEFVNKTNLSQKSLAHRIGKGSDQVSRWLSSPGNWTIDTISDLLLGISGSELALSISKVADRLPSHSHGPGRITAGYIMPSQQQTVYIGILQGQSNIPPSLPSLTPYISVATTVPHRYQYPSLQLEA